MQPQFLDFTVFLNFASRIEGLLEQFLKPNYVKIEYMNRREINLWPNYYLSYDVFECFIVVDKKEIANFASFLQTNSIRKLIISSSDATKLNSIRNC